MSIRVWQSHPPNDDGMYADWEVECSAHPLDSHATCADWTWAMEAAWGHIAMHHASPPMTLLGMPVHRLSKYPDLS